MIKAIVFDLDDTLISEREYIKSGFKVVANYIGDKNSIPYNQIFKRMLEEFEVDKKNVFNRVLDSFEIKYSNKEIKYLIDLYRNHIPDISFYNGVTDTLKKLKENGYKLGIITDGYKESQRAKLRVLNCNNLFDYIVITDELGREYWKPHEKPYKLISKKLNVNLDQIIYVGDNLEKDFITAKKLGITTICIKRKESIYRDNIGGDEKKQSKFYIKDIREVLNYIK